MFLIRDMTKADEAEVLKMMKIFYASDAVFFKASEDILKRDIADAIDTNMPLIDGFVFETNDGKLGGYAMTAMNYSTEFGGLTVWLEDLYLKPEFQGCGFSKIFFEYLEKRYPHAVRFKLEVETENEQAIAAYKKNGYKVSPYFVMTKEII